MDFEIEAGLEYRITFSDGHRENTEFEGVGHRDSGDQFIRADGSLIHVGALKAICDEDGKCWVVKGMRVSDIREATHEEIEAFVQEHVDGGPIHHEALDITLFDVLSDEGFDDEDDDDADILAAAADTGNPVAAPEFGSSSEATGPAVATEVAPSPQQLVDLEAQGLGEPGVEMPTTFDQLPDSVVEAIVNDHTSDEASSEEAPAAE